MKPALLLCLCVIVGFAARAQLRVLAQAGLENSRTSVTVNDQKSFSPLGNIVCPQTVVRADYKLKGGHGPYVALAAARPVVAYGFSDGDAGRYTAERGEVRFRLEGGYQVSTKPIYFKKAPAAKPASTNAYQKSGQQSRCGKSVARTGCGNKGAVAKSAAKRLDTRTWMRIQPSLGMAYIPFAQRATIAAKNEGAQPLYTYNAGSWTTALASGIGFEFGKASQSKFMVGLNYIKGIGNLGTQSITTVSGNKPVTTNLKSAASSWNVLVGIPLFAKKPPVAKQHATQKATNERKPCGSYKMQYKSRCTRTL